jgi:hypothetical protein
MYGDIKSDMAILKEGVKPVAGIQDSIRLRTYTLVDHERRIKILENNEMSRPSSTATPSVFASAIQRRGH